MRKKFSVHAIAALLCVGIAHADETDDIANLIIDLNNAAKKNEIKAFKTIARKTNVPVSILVEQRKKTGLSPGELYVAHSIAAAAKMKFEHIVSLSNKGQGWVQIAQQYKVRLVKPKTGIDDAARFQERLQVVPSGRR